MRYCYAIIACFGNVGILGGCAYATSLRSSILVLLSNDGDHANIRIKLSHEPVAILYPSGATLRHDTRFSCEGSLATTLR
jgi:hypothetical protein